MTVWWVVAGLIVVCVAMRAAGPVLIGDQALPMPVQRIVAVMAPALLAGLVVAEVVGERGEHLDTAMATGVLTAAVARVLHAPLLVAVALGAGVAAGLRVLG